MKMFQQRKITPKPTFQVLLKNRLEKQFQKLVHSFNFALHLFFSSKYCLQNNHVYSRGKKYLTISFCFMVFMNTLCAYVGLAIGARDNTFISFIGALFHIVQAFCFTILYILDIVHKHNNVFLILNMQAIHKSICFNKSIRSYITWNWISVLTCIFVVTYLNVNYFIFHYDFTFAEIMLQLICDIMFISFDVNYIVAIRVIVLINIYLDEWIKEILKLDDNQDSIDHCQKLLGIYQQILKAYNLYKKIYQALTLSYVIVKFVHIMCSYYFIIYEIKINRLSKIKPAFFGVDSVFFLSRNIILTIMHSIYCERFYITVEEAETACVQLLKNRNCPKTQKYLYKNVVLANRSYSKMNACGVFYIDATLPMGLIGVIINYAFVLWQFTFM